MVALVAKAVLSGRSDAIIAADQEGIIRFWNPGAERLFGFERAEALGQRWPSVHRTLKSEDISHCQKQTCGF